jgi:ABC-type glycerol-3-phosphate transport system permease component
LSAPALPRRRRRERHGPVAPRRSRLIKATVLYPSFTIVAVVILFPIVWMVYSAFKSNDAIFADVFGLPHSLYTGNFTTVFGEGGLGRFFVNSAFVTACSVIGLIVFSSLAAYAFSMFEFRGRSALYLFALIGLMVPPQALIVSGFKWMSILHLIDTYWALIFTYFGWVSFGILVLRDFFLGVPGELKEAARIDGAGHWQLFTRVMLPLAKPSIATVAIFYFVWVWNEFIYPLIYLQDQHHYTLPLGIIYLNGQYTSEWGLQMAALTAATAIPVIVYYVFQRQFVRGMLSGALKG